MATRIIPNVTEGDTAKITVEFDNGDLQALETIVQQGHFKSKESVLRFALAVLTKAKNTTVFVTDETGARVPLSPSPGLLETPDEKSV